jgi:hypothetical protein
LNNEQFALKTFGGTPMDLKNNGFGQNSTRIYSGRGDGFTQLDDNNSKDAIIAGDQVGIVTKREVWQDVSDANSDHTHHTGEK